MSSQLPPAGWHVDPSDPTLQRYWNGAGWTAHTTPVTPDVASAASAPLAPPAYGVAPVPPNAGSAVLALVLGVLSLLCGGALIGIPAMIVARKATREIDQSQGQLGGRGMATAGFVTGLIGTLISALAFVFVLGVFAFGGVVESSFETTCDTINPDPIGNPECFD